MANRFVGIDSFGRFDLLFINKKITKMSKETVINISLAVAVLMIFVIIIILMIKSGFFEKDEDPLNVYDKDTDKDNLSYEDSQYMSFASSLKSAFYGPGTTEETVFRVLRQLNTKDDWNKLVSVYGTDKDGYDLPGRLSYELNNREMERVNEILNKIGVYV